MSKQTNETKHTRPAHEIRIGLIEAAIWANPTEDGVRHNVTFERCYRENEEWEEHEFLRARRPAQAGQGRGRSTFLDHAAGSPEEGQRRARRSATQGPLSGDSNANGDGSPSPHTRTAKVHNVGNGSVVRPEGVVP